MFFSLNKARTADRQKAVDPRFGYFDKNDKTAYLSKSDDFLVHLKGPVSADGVAFFAFVSKMKMNELAEQNGYFQGILSGFPELRIKEKGDFDTPILIKFRVKGTNGNPPKNG